MSDEHPELAGYRPDDERPVRRPMAVGAMRVVVAIAILALIVPGVVISIATANNTANVACGLVVAQEAPDSVAYGPRFELWGVDGPGWYCYAEQFDGTEVLLRALGLIPEVHWAPREGVPV